MDWFPYISSIGLIWTSDAFFVTEKWSTDRKKENTFININGVFLINILTDS